MKTVFLVSIKSNQIFTYPCRYTNRLGNGGERQSMFFSAPMFCNLEIISLPAFLLLATHPLSHTHTNAQNNK